MDAAMTSVSRSALASLQARVLAHPWRTLGGAFLLGAWLGIDPPRAPRNAVARTVFALIGSVAIRVAREVALGELIERTARPNPPRSAWPMQY
jgi:hypothetical protein